MPPMPQQPGQESSGMGILWVMAAIVISVWGIWHFAHTQIVIGFFYVKRFEIEIIRFFTGKVNEIYTLIVNTPPDQVTFQKLTEVATQVGYYIRFPIMIIILTLAMLLFFRSAAGKFNQTYNMKSLLNYEINNWPQSMPIMKLNLVHVDIDQGPWAMAMNPMVFARHYKLLTQPEKYQEVAQLNAQTKMRVSVIKERANRVFVTQLGRLWQGADALPIHTKALFVAFAARGAKDSDSSIRLLDQISRSAGSEKLNFSGVDVLLKKYMGHPEVREVIDHHAYELTVMASLLEFARTDGVLASSEFLWLKPLDRRLWLMLSTVGRQTAVAEIAGPFAHWLIEKKLHRRLKIPMVDQATIALEEAIKGIVYKPSVQIEKQKGAGK